MRRREALIRELAAELEPAPRLRSPHALALLWWLGAWLFVAAVAPLVAPLREGFAEQLLASPRFAAETGLGLVAGALAIAVAFRLGVPGSARARRAAPLALGVVGLWAAGYVYGLVDPALPPSPRGARPLCFAEVLLYGLPALAAGLVLLRRLAPLHRSAAGACAGAAAGAVPALLMQVGCMYVPAHILSHHVGPAVALVAVGALAGPALLRRP